VRYCNQWVHGFGNIVEGNGTNWTGSLPSGSNYFVHNKNGGVDYSMANHEAFTSNWSFGGKLQLDSYQFWIDRSGKLRIKNGSPTSDTDGTVVGSQS
jgi:hypothetical protein